VVLTFLLVLLNGSSKEKGIREIRNTLYIGVPQRKASGLLLFLKDINSISLMGQIKRGCPQKYDFWNTLFFYYY
jgi:hypothetical protein